MTLDVEFPGLVWVKDPVNKETGVPTGEPPRMRHHEDCMHWYRDHNGVPIGPQPYKASEGQMRTLPPCRTCAGSVGSGGESAGGRAGALGAVCPTCFMEMPLVGTCPNCS